MSATPVDGTETLNPPSIVLKPGTGVLTAGVGLIDAQPGSIAVDVPLNATVEQVLLYVEGANPTGKATPHQLSVDVNGTQVVATFIGGNTEYGPHLFTATYRADITSMDAVRPGPNLLTVGGVSFGSDNDGAGLFVVIDDGGPLSSIDIRDGNDVAYFKRAPPLNTTVPQTFHFAPATFDRLGAVDFIVGSVAGGGKSIATMRPNSIELTTNGVTSVFSDQLDSVDGKYWDSVRIGVTVPAGATSLTAQVFSRDDGLLASGNLPASLVWVASSLSVVTPTVGECWITTGGFQNAGSPSGGKLYTFGGNVGPPPHGSWQVIDHVTKDNFHSNDVHITSCSTVGTGGPGQPGGKKGLKVDRADFAGTGRLNFVDGYPFVGYVIDAGEPSGKKSNQKDQFSITVFDPVTNAVVFQASGELDGGNVQIHPPTGGGGKK